MRVLLHKIEGVGAQDMREHQDRFALPLMVHDEEIDLAHELGLVLSAAFDEHTDFGSSGL
jgi:hypothetical protein